MPLIFNTLNFLATCNIPVQVAGRSRKDRSFSSPVTNTSFRAKRVTLQTEQRDWRAWFVAVTVHGPHISRAPQSRSKTSSPHSGTLLHQRKLGGPGAAPGGTVPTASPNFPSLGFPLPRATSTAIPRPHRRRASSRRDKSGRTRRPGVREAGVAPPHPQPWPPLGTSTPQGLPLPFPLTRQAARKKAEAAPLGSRPPGGGSRRRASGRAVAGAGGRGDAARRFPGSGRWGCAELRAHCPMWVPRPRVLSGTLRKARRREVGRVGEVFGPGTLSPKSGSRNEVDPTDFLEPSRGRGRTLAGSLSHVSPVHYGWAIVKYSDKAAAGPGCVHWTLLPGENAATLWERGFVVCF